MDLVQDEKGVFEREGAEPVKVAYEFRIGQEFEGGKAGLFRVPNGRMVLVEADPNLLALYSGNESCRLVLASGLSLEISIASPAPMAGTTRTWEVKIMGDSVKELLKERGLS